MSATLTVVVPIYNVEPYLPQLLESLSNQELTDIEFILVNDGSLDASADIARERVGRDRRFRLLSQENLGLSAARNAGAAVASGTYLAFADADDVVPPAAYRRLVQTLERTGSAFASGDVRRLDSTGVHRHPRYADVFARTRIGTHVTRDEALILDRMIWNKVFRRAFWDANRLRFTLPRYEDAPVTVRAHLSATAVDVLSEVVYLWRIRETGEPSITQRLYEPDNIADRMRMMVETGRIIDGAPATLRDAYARDMLTGDIRYAVLAARTNDAADLAGTIALVRRFVGGVAPGLLDELPAPYRRKVRLLAEGRIEELRAEPAVDA